jgi:hypothetical protein
MPYSQFHARFPEVAERETRTITVIDPFSFNLPPAHYAFLEMFCDEPGCDCRRAFFTVVSSLQNDSKAVIAWGWEDKKFYRKWMGRNDPQAINDLKGPVLNLASPQSELAPALLKLFQRLLLPDRDYIERVKRHYALFRETVDSKTKKKMPKKKMINQSLF